MRKIKVFSMISLDGVMQAPGGRDEDNSDGFKYGGWTSEYGSKDFSEILQEEMRPADYLLGRTTFDIWESYWPNHADFWPAINEGTKYVLSTSRNKSDWKNTIFVNSLNDIKEIKSSEGIDIQVWGSSKLIHLLLKNSLVDELRLKVYPVILGQGKKLFENDAILSAFTLSKSYVTTKGVFIGYYKQAGKVMTGDIKI